MNLDTYVDRALRLLDQEKVSSAAEAVKESLAGAGANDEQVHRVSASLNRRLLTRAKKSSSSPLWSQRFETAKPDEIVPGYAVTETDSGTTEKTSSAETVHSWNGLIIKASSAVLDYGSLDRERRRRLHSEGHLYTPEELAEREAAHQEAVEKVSAERAGEAGKVQIQQLLQGVRDAIRAAEGYLVRSKLSHAEALAAVLTETEAAIRHQEITLGEAGLALKKVGEAENVPAPLMKESMQELWGELLERARVDLDALTGRRRTEDGSLDAYRIKTSRTVLDVRFIPEVDNRSAFYKAASAYFEERSQLAKAEATLEALREKDRQWRQQQARVGA